MIKAPRPWTALAAVGVERRQGSFTFRGYFPGGAQAWLLVGRQPLCGFRVAALIYYRQKIADTGL
jgi:hypothetical protein